MYVWLNFLMKDFQHIINFFNIRKNNTIGWIKNLEMKKKFSGCN